MTGKRTVAYIGDSTFFHSGLPALANAVKENDNITVIILDNCVAAMTGFQPSLTTIPPEPPAGTQSESAEIVSPHRFSIEDAVHGLGVRDVYSVDPYDQNATLEALGKAKAGTGVNVVVCHSPCVVDQHRSKRGERRQPLAIDAEVCNACSLCVRVLGCPAILVENGKYTIDPELCDGCGLCSFICQYDAIHPVAPMRI